MPKEGVYVNIIEQADRHKSRYYFNLWKIDKGRQEFISKLFDTKDLAKDNAIGIADSLGWEINKWMSSFENVEAILDELEELGYEDYDDSYFDDEWED